MARPGYMSIYADERAQQIFDEFVKMWKKTAFCVDFFDVIKEYKISVNCCKIRSRYDIMTIQ